MTLAQLPAWAADMLAGERVARLAFSDDAGQPRVLPVTFAVAAGSIWTAIDQHKPKRNTEPARVRWLRQRPRASLLVDVYSDDWTELAWVQVLGEVTILEAGDGPGQEGIAALRERYEPYRERAPSGPLLRLDVERALCWRARDSAQVE